MHIHVKQEGNGYALSYLVVSPGGSVTTETTISMSLLDIKSLGIRIKAMLDLRASDDEIPEEDFIRKQLVAYGYNKIYVIKALRERRDRLGLDVPGLRLCLDIVNEVLAFKAKCTPADQF